MPFPLIATLIPSLATIATSFISFGMQSSETEKARAEEKSLASVTRQDELNTQRKSNLLNEKSSRLTDKELSFNENMSKQNIGIQQQSDLYEQKKSGRDQLTSASQGMNPSDDSWLYKSKILNRF